MAESVAASSEDWCLMLELSNQRLLLKFQLREQTFLHISPKSLNQPQEAQNPLGAL